MSHVTTLYCTHCLFPNRFSGERPFSVSMFACVKCGKESEGSPVTQVWHDAAHVCFVPGCACRAADQPNVEPLLSALADAGLEGNDELDAAIDADNRRMLEAASQPDAALATLADELEEASTVLDEQVHRDAICNVMLRAARALRGGNPDTTADPTTQPSAAHDSELREQIGEDMATFYAADNGEVESTTVNPTAAHAAFEWLRQYALDHPREVHATVALFAWKEAVDRSKK